MRGDDLTFAADRLTLDAARVLGEANSLGGRGLSAGSVILAERMFRVADELRAFAPRLDLIQEIVRFEDPDSHVSNSPDIAAGQNPLF